MEHINYENTNFEETCLIMQKKYKNRTEYMFSSYDINTHYIFDNLRQDVMYMHMHIRAHF